jgi:hypothetical protein
LFRGTDKKLVEIDNQTGTMGSGLVWRQPILFSIAFGGPAHYVGIG